MSDPIRRLTKRSLTLPGGLDAFYVALAKRREVDMTEVIRAALIEYKEARETGPPLDVIEQDRESEPYRQFCEARHETITAFQAWLETKPPKDDVRTELDGMLNAFDALERFFREN